MKIFYSILFILISITAHSQHCDNYFFLCSNLQSSDFVNKGSSVTFTGVVDGNTCVRGSENGTSWSTSQSINQTWFLLKVENSTGHPVIPINYNSSLGNISIAYFGALPTNTNVCSFLDVFPNRYKNQTRNSSLEIFSSEIAAVYAICIINEGNSPQTINLSTTVPGVEFYEYVPSKPACIKPTAEIVTNSVLKKYGGGDMQPIVVRFTGEPPFSYRINDLNYTHYSNELETVPLGQNRVFQDTRVYLSEVRNACGAGQILGEEFTFLYYDKDTTLLSCYPFDGDYFNYQSGLEKISGNGTFVSDRNNNENSALLLENQVIKYPGRDLKGENFTISLWIKPLPNVSSEQVVFALGSSAKSGVKLSFVDQAKFTLQVTTQEENVYIVSIPGIVNSWQHLTLVKNNTSIQIVSSIGQQTEVPYPISEVPNYGPKSIMAFGGDYNSLSHFRGVIDDFKYFSGILPNQVLSNLSEETSCSLKLCSEVPIVTLPGYLDVLPGVSVVDYKFEYTYEGAGYLKFQIDKGVIGKSNSPYFSIPTHKAIIKNGKPFLINHLSSSCGTAEFRDTLVVKVGARLSHCFNLNGNTNDNFGTVPYIKNSFGQFVQDRNGIENQASQLSTFSKMAFTTSKVLSDNYSVSFWFKPNLETNIGQGMNLFAYNYIVQDKLQFVKKENSIEFIFYKATSDPIFIVEVPYNTEDWMHVVLTVGKGSERNKIVLNFFVNGQKVLSKVQNFNPSNYESSGNVVIGPGITGESFPAYLLDDVKIYTGSLGDELVSSIFNSNSECMTPLCNNFANIEISNLDRNEFEYGQNIINTILLKDNGPVTLSYSINGYPERKLSLRQQTTIINGSDNVNFPISEGNYNTGENEIRLFKITNQCGTRTDTVTYKFQIKPKQVLCLPQDNLSEIEGITNLELSNVKLSQNRNFVENRALKYDLNSNHTFNTLQTLNRNLSISLWIKPQEQSNVISSIINIGGSAHNKISLIRINDGFLVRFSRGIQSNLSTYFEMTSSSKILKNQWSHITITWGSELAKIYINGILDKEISNSSYFNFLNMGDTPLVRIGSNSSNEEKYVGELDDIKFFNGVLNDFEIRHLVSNSISCNFRPCKETESINGVVSESLSSFGGNSLQSTATLKASNTFLSEKTIELLPGFQTEPSIVFKAIIGGCPESE